MLLGWLFWLLITQHKTTVTRLNTSLLMFNCSNRMCFEAHRHTSHTAMALGSTAPVKAQRHDLKCTPSTNLPKSMGSRQDDTAWTVRKVAPSKFFFTVSHYVHTASSTTPFAQLTEPMFGHPFSMADHKAQTNIQPSIKPLGKIG